MKLSNKLKKLIFGYNNIILVNTNASIEDLFKEVEIIRNSLTIEGWLFRPNFANSVEFKEYTNEDYQAIYAQWSLSFGWSKIYSVLTGTEPEDILSEYRKNYDKDLTPVFTETKEPIVEDNKYIYNIATEIISSKNVLTDNQKEIISALPTNIKLSIFKKANISIRETKTLLVKSIMKKDPDFNPFLSIDDIVPLCVELYNIKEPISTINKSNLKDVKLRIPVSAKRKILNSLSSFDLSSNRVKSNIKKYQSFWKAILRELRISGSTEKTISQYPVYSEFKNLVYSNIKTNNSDIESFKAKGLLAEAFDIEMENVGSMLRNISFYLRNPVGETYPSKEDISTIIKIKVKSDVSMAIKSDRFFNVLRNANPRLLLQLKGILTDKRNLYPKTFTRIDSKRKTVRYDIPVPAINDNMTKIVLDVVNKVYKEIKVDENKSLGTVFISPSLSSKKISFSGRVDTGKSTSGEYLSLGSKIKIPELSTEGKLLRYGVSWRSKKDGPSICIDPSISFLNGKHSGKVINWQCNNHTLDGEKEILVSSSGDITDCSMKTFSTELVDINTFGLKKENTTKFFTAIINYNFPKGDFKEVETYVFFNIIDKKDRIVGTNISVDLSQMAFSYEVDEAVNGQIGLLFDTEENTVEVVKMAFDVYQSDTATQKNPLMIELLENRSDLPNVYDALMDAISSDQIVSDIDDADLVIDNSYGFSKIQSILF